MRFGELCAGVGGLSQGLVRAGWAPVFHAEIDPFAVRVLHARFPEIPVYGDVKLLDGRSLAAKHGNIDLLVGGMPCTDVSQAGKRAGIHAPRSGLFFDLVRIWNETGAPFCLYENVVGLLSSGKGEDFGHVLSALVGADVGRAVDKKGRPRKWAGSGVVCGPTGRAAWRVLDAQHWGPPQRRRRVFVLAARPGFPCPEEILFEREGVLGDSATGGATDENLARHPRAGPPVGGSVKVLSFNSHSNGEDLSRARNYEVTPSLTGESQGTHTPAVVVFDTKQSGESARDVAPTMRAMAHDKSWINGGGQLGVVRGLALSRESGMIDYCNCGKSGASRSGGIPDCDGQCEIEGQAYPIQNDAIGRSGENLTPTPDAEGRVRIRPPGLGVGKDGDPMYTLSASGPQHAVVAFDKAQITHPENRSRIEVGKPSPTLNASGMMHVARMLAFGHYVEDGTASAMKARDYKDATDLVFGVSAPRRLMPIECERLMDWDDNWTDVPDEKGKPASDSARYRACGNGVVSACVEWIALRLRAQLELHLREAA